MLLFAGEGIFDTKSDEELLTLVFNTFVFMQVFNEINSRKVNQGRSRVHERIGV